MPTKMKSLSVTYKQMSALARIGKGAPQRGLCVVLSKNPHCKKDESEEMEEALTFIDEWIVESCDFKTPLAEVYSVYCDTVFDKMGKQKFKRTLIQQGYDVSKGAKNRVYVFNAEIRISDEEDW